jgi:NADPH:quinone reductase-like Zn-dependent oxidoreductase
MVRAINANGMRPVIDKEFPVESMVDAFRYQETNQHFGKICLNV